MHKLVSLRLCRALDVALSVARSSRAAVVHQQRVICVLKRGMGAQDGVVEVCRTLDIPIAAASVVQNRIVYRHCVIHVLKKGTCAQDGIVEVYRGLNVQITTARSSRAAASINTATSVCSSKGCAHDDSNVVQRDNSAEAESVRKRRGERSQAKRRCGQATSYPYPGCVPRKKLATQCSGQQSRCRTGKLLKTYFGDKCF